MSRLPAVVRRCCRCSRATCWNRASFASIVRAPPCHWMRFPLNCNRRSNRGRRSTRRFTLSPTGKTASAKARATTTAPSRTLPGKPSGCWRRRALRSRPSFWIFTRRRFGKTRTNVWKCARRTFRCRGFSRYPADRGQARANRHEFAVVAPSRRCYKCGMKKLFKWMFRLILALLLLVLLLVLFLDQIAKSLAEREIRSQTGLEVKIGRVSIGLRKPTLTVEDFKLVNSSDFGGSTFMDIPELYAQYDLSALRSWKVHLNLVRLNLGELHIVQNKDGKTNLQVLQEHQ